MLNRIKTLCVLTVSLAVATASFGATVTVRKDGTGNFLTVDAALESLDYQDGENDLVLIGPGVFDGQVTVNAHAGANSTRYPNAFNMTGALVESAYLTHTDALTLRGENPNDPPVLTVLTGEDRAPQPYGVFPNEPGDFFFASLVMVGNNATFENIDFRHGMIDYCINGQAAGIVFNDCLFTNGLAGGGESYGNYNNNIEITSHVNAAIAADNEYTFNNCLFDGLNKVDGISFQPGDAFYFHGYGEIPLKPNTDPPLYGFTHFSGCTFRDWASTIHVATTQSGVYYRGLDNVVVEDCFSDNVSNTLNSRGPGQSTVVNRNVFKLGGVNSSRGIEISTRNGGIQRNLIVSNNIFDATVPNQQLRLDMDANSTSAPQVGDWRVVNNTFFGATGPAIETSGSLTSPGGSVAIVIANNILNTDGGVGVRHNASGPVTVDLVNNAFFGNAADIDGAGAVNTNVGVVNADPQFDNTAVTQPATPGASQVQGFNPTNAAYLNAGSQAAYNAVSSVVGTLDVDQTHTTANVDIGAQQNEPISVLDWSIY